MDSSNPSKSAIRFAGFVFLWNGPRRAGESTRRRFSSIYQDLQLTVQQQHGSELSPLQHKWKIVRLSAPGKRFFGIVRG